MIKYSTFNTADTGTLKILTKGILVAKRLDEQRERDHLAQARRARYIQATKFTMKALFLLALLAACYFLFSNNMEHIKALIAKPLLPKHWPIGISHYFNLTKQWLQWHIDVLWNWVITTGDKYGYWIIAAPVFLVSWRITRWLYIYDMTLLEFVGFLFKCALVIAIFAAMLYGAIIFVALAALAICGPLVAGGVARPGINHRWRY
jgi:hypothetical protein